MSEPDLDQLVAELQGFERIVAGWEDHQQATVTALRSTVEAIQKEAFRRIVKAVKEDPGGMAALRGAVQDPWVHGVLTYHGLLRPAEPPMEARIEAVLTEIRPTLARHEGDVELVGWVPPDEVQIRMLGSCDGCSISSITVKLGIEKQLKERLPQVQRVTVVGSRTPARPESPAASPYSAPWEDAADFAGVPTGEVIAVDLSRISVLLTRIGDEVKAYPNACAHLGMPLDQAHVAGGVLTCRYHGFRYRLDTGECLTAPEIALPSYPVEIRGGRVRVQVTT